MEVRFSDPFLRRKNKNHTFHLMQDAYFSLNKVSWPFFDWVSLCVFEANIKQARRNVSNNFI